MFVEKEVIKILRENWNLLSEELPLPKNFTFLKIHGRPSPNASILVIILNSEKHIPIALAKIPRNPKYINQIKKEFENIRNIASLDLSPDILHAVPTKTILSSVDECSILLQSACIGYPMVRDFTRSQKIKYVYQPVIEWMFNFHKQTAQKEFADDKEIRRLLNEPVNRIKSEMPELFNSFSREAKQYFEFIQSGLDVEHIVLTRQHCDFNAHNILINKERRIAQDFFVIDWEDCLADQLPIHDLNHFFISNSKLLDRSGTTESTFDKFILTPGWYQKLYFDYVKAYASLELIDEKTFWQLTPLYLISMCTKVADQGRQQENTAAIWARRAELFIERFPMIKK